MKNKISIGTANFNLNYGLNKKNITQKNIDQILRKLSDKKIFNLDTAIEYNNSKQISKNTNLTNWNITSKISNLTNLRSKNLDLSNFLLKSVEAHLADLNISKLDTLLLHKIDDIFYYKSNLHKCLIDLKKRKLIKNFGYSIYDTLDLKTLISKYPPDTIQCPFNIFDRRIYKSGWLTRLKNKKIKLQVRSIFLQGLLLNKMHQSVNFSKYNNHFKTYYRWLEKKNISSIEASIAFIKNYPGIDKVVIGCENVNQLELNIECFNKTNIKIPRYLLFNDTKLIDPSRW